MQTFSLSGELTLEQISFYDTHGFLHFKNFIPKDTVTRFLAEITRVNERLIAENVSKVNGIPLKFGTGINGKPIIQRLAFASRFSPALRNFLKDARFNSLFVLLGNYNGRIGEYEKDGLVVNHYENTPQSSFKSLGWHTDSPRDLFLGSRIMPMLNVGLHLDDCPKRKWWPPGTARYPQTRIIRSFIQKEIFRRQPARPGRVGI